MRRLKQDIVIRLSNVILNNKISLFDDQGCQGTNKI